MAAPLADTGSLLQELARPTKAYKRHVWIAVSGLALFVALYVVFAGWFLLTAYRLTVGADSATFPGYLVGTSALFLSVFMLKAVFAVKRGDTKHMVEITREQQPRLFAFADEIADSAEAPRPHKVFLSPRVGASVFYDLSAINLIFPSRKNLEIGLGLVNGLALGELRAVLAHEFGHFTQRAMAVGRWAYVAHQIAADLVTRRDRLDAFLARLSRFDLRVAWIGWILSIIVWSIRSLVDSAFHLVVLLERALSREMEMHADLVSVALTGSDALIHALHRLQAADDSWERALNFMAREHAQGRPPRDAFAIQSRLIERMGEILNDPGYGRVPSVPISDPENHRLFKAELAQPPKMWLTHPLNHEREANAKRRYIRAAIDERSSWTLFDQEESVREQVTALLVPAGEKGIAPIGQTLESLNAEFARESLQSRYRGVYLGRSIVRGAASTEGLVEMPPGQWPRETELLYPETLIDEVARLRQLGTELGQLRALKSGVLKPAEGVLRHRGRTIQRRDLGHVIEDVEREFADVEESLRAGDRRRRTVHLAAARAVGNGWPEFLQGLHATLHYANHTEANLRDLQGMLANAVHVATITGRVSSAGRQKVIDRARELHLAMAEVHRLTPGVHLDDALIARLGAASWQALIGTFDLPAPDETNVGEWITVIDGWVDQAAGPHALLGQAALDEMLLAEASIVRHLEAGTPPGAAPSPSGVPTAYATLLAGQERKRQTQLDWWERFQIADGVVPTVARVAVAATIVVAVLGFGTTVGRGTIHIYNALQRTVYVDVAGTSTTLQPMSTHELEVDPGLYRVVARTADGVVIDSFPAEIPGSFARFIYNVAGAAPLVEWTAVYGNAQPVPERFLGSPRWARTSADAVFTDPPESMRTSGGGATLRVVSSGAESTPMQQLELLSTDAERHAIIGAHVRWDATNSEWAADWLDAASRVLPGFRDLLAARLAATPNDVILLRIEQDVADSAERAAACARASTRASAEPTNGDIAYVASRCLPTSGARDDAFADGYRRWPGNPWFAFAAGRGFAERARWAEAMSALERASIAIPALRHAAVVDMARIHRLVAAPKREEGSIRLQNIVRPDTTLDRLATRSSALRAMLAMETDESVTATAHRAHFELTQGRLEQALKTAAADPELAGRMLRLVAASDGAPAAVVNRALADSAAGLDRHTWWASLGLAARTGRSLDPYFAAAPDMAAEHGDLAREFIAHVRAGRFAAAEERLLGAEISARGHCYAIGLIMLGDRAPARWRRAAKALLFGPERPFFR